MNEVIWILINVLEREPVRAEALAKRIKAGKTDLEFIQSVENVFWAYIPHVNLIPDLKTEKFRVLKIISFGKMN